MKKVYATLIGLVIWLTGFSQSCLPEGIEFSTQAQIDSFQVNYPNCTQIDGDVTINGEDITNLNGLNVVTSIGGNLFIGTYFYRGNSLLTNLTGLEGLTNVAGKVDINLNPVLTSLTGLDNLTSIGLSLFIYGNPLNSLAGLANLTFIGGGISIISNYTLTSLTGLDNLTYIGGSISISENVALTNLTGLDNIDPASIDDLSIYNNSSLSSCSVQSICDYLASPNGVVIVRNNSTGCNTPPEIADGCGITLPCLPFGNYYFNTQAYIDSFQTNYPECTSLQGYVKIEGDDITNLNGLNMITSFGYDLFIELNPALTTLTGLNRVNSIGHHLFIAQNNALISLTGLDSLISIGLDFDISNNEDLIDITELTSLNSIGRYLNIVYNSTLTSLSGLENIDAGTILGLEIRFNNSLSTCEVQSICDYLANPSGAIEIYGNAFGCNSPEEVITACEVGVDESAVISLQSSVRIYPNPASTTITISTPTTPDKNTFMTILNISGQVILSRQITETKTQLDIKNLPSGVYFVRITTDATVMVSKFIKQ